ncbi:MAG: ATP-binding cassette domain-containing protein [Methanolinea sp.]|nr:ATP-binding cassette domain-containing protein [Methanolinea sp.]
MIAFENVSKRYGEREVLDGISFGVDEGEIFALIGPSGTGKTTILRLIAMLEDPTAGRITFMGRDTRVPEQERVFLRRQMGMVFQKPSVLRGSVHENVALGLKFRGYPPAEISRRVSEVLALVGLRGLERASAASLSGGELQRVAIARAIAPRPRLLLLDEPTANLDPVATEEIEDLISTLNREENTTVIFSTHDMAQGQRLATRVGVVLGRKMRELGDPFQVFSRPGSREVARMVGIENIFAGVVVGNEGGLARIDVSGVHVHAPCEFPPGTRVHLFLRAADVTVSTGADGGRSSARNVLPATITRVVACGPNARLALDAGIPIAALVTRQSCSELGLSAGKVVSVSFKANAVHVVPAPGSDEDSERNG